MTTQGQFQEALKELTREFPNRQTVRLGRLDGITVQTGVSGELYARQWNGKEIKVINRGLVPARFDLRVLVGSTQLQPTKWFTLITIQDYLTPADGGAIGYHEHQHEFGQEDMVPIDRKQIMAFSLVATSTAWTVQLYGGLFQSLTRLTVVPSSLYNLSGYVTSSGAYYLAFECNDAGAVTLVQGSDFGDPAAGSENYVPKPPEGSYLIGYVIFFAGQTSLLQDHIRCVMPLGVIPKVTGTQIHEAATDTPLDADEFGFWDVVDNLLKKVTWANIKATLKTYFDTLYVPISSYVSVIFNDAEGDPAEVITSGSPSDGTSTYAARRNHVHHVTPTELVMETGVSSPPVPLENSDGTDWIYSS